MEGDADDYDEMPTLDAAEMADVSGIPGGAINLETSLSSEAMDEGGAARAPGNTAARQQQQQQPPRQLKPEECKHFACIYPSYMDADLTVAKGRRLPKNKLVGCWYHRTRMVPRWCCADGLFVQAMG